MKHKQKIQDIKILRKINNNIGERTLLRPFQKVLIAVSGGQDSICLMRILYHLKTQWQWNLGIVHCDHRWNCTSQLQAKHVARLAASMQIDYYQPVAIQCVKQETVARNWRYQMIQTIAVDHDYTAVVTAHSASDRIETLLYHLIRGTGLQGIQSLSWKRQLSNMRYSPWKSWITTLRVCYKNVKYIKNDGMILYHHHIPKLQLIRPLLDTTRTEIRNLLHWWRLPCWPDPTNQTVRMRRNRIRHRLIPYIRLHYNPRVDQALARWSEIVHAENVYLERLTSSILSKIEVNINMYKGKIPTSGISMELFASLPIVFQRRILRKFLYQYIQRDLSFHYIEHIRLYCIFSKSFSFSSKQSYMTNNIVSRHTWMSLPGKVKLLILDKVIVCILAK